MLALYAHPFKLGPAVMDLSIPNSLPAPMERYKAARESVYEWRKKSAEPAHLLAELRPDRYKAPKGITGPKFPVEEFLKSEMRHCW